MIPQELSNRSNNVCELCLNSGELTVYQVLPEVSAYLDNELVICGKCLAQIDRKEQIEPNHWRVLSETMWSEHPAVQVMAWRMLSRLRAEAWAADNLDILYLDDELLTWAKRSGDHEQDADIQFHTDANATRLYDGDTVVLVKTLDVKGSSLSAKLGTVVKNIRLVSDNVEQIEGKIEGQTIVILTKYVRKG